MLVGTNTFPCHTAGVDGAGIFVSTSNEVGNDSLRRIFEKALSSDNKDFNSYDQKLRAVMSEQMALDGLASILDAPPTQAGFKYYAPESNDRIGLLDSGCADPNTAGKQCRGRRPFRDSQ